MALLLPLRDDALRTPAEAVRRGFVAAAGIGEAIPFRVYATRGDAEDALRVYGEAVAAGARVVVGPLARNQVTALCRRGEISAPTLSLSLPDLAPEEYPTHLTAFGLSVEEEVRQVADLAWKDGRRRALVVVAATPFAKRIAAAFAPYWQSLGGSIAGELSVMPGREAALASREDGGADMLFFATGAIEARLARPYLPRLPAYATSHAFAGRLRDVGQVDLAGVNFVDMPWLLAPDHPAVMVYPRSQPAQSVELERLYALGIDAQRLATLLWRGRLEPGFTLDGVTGRLRLGADRIVHREALPAVFLEDTVAIREDSQP